jgi:glyoxylase-like metal-dependent hydrolase (beta-lactamase superfamily II)
MLALCSHREAHLMPRTAPIILLAALVTACTSATPEQQIVNDAAAALGGRDRVLAVKTLVIEGEGTQGNLGQDMTPDAASQTFSVTFRRTMDLTSSRSHTELTRTPNFTYFRGPAPQKQSADAAPAEFHHHPLTIVRAALDPAAKLSNPRTMGNERVIGLTTPAGLDFTLAIDASTHLPTRVVSMGDHTVLGDVANETTFADYQDAGTLKLPARTTTKVDRFTTATATMKHTVDGDVGALAAPAAAPPAVPASIAVEELARGVWLLAGQSHHSVVIEFADHLVLYEAPSEARTLAVIGRARELRPNKPLTRVVNSHHHFDHSAGIRAAVAEGLEVITHKTNAGFFNDLVGRSRTLVPDALAKAPKPLKLTAVDDALTLQDATMTMQLFHVPGNPHGDAILMAYLPRERLLIEADVYSPGSPIHPFAANLVENIKRRNLRVDRIVPIHGTVVPLAELIKATQPSPTN